MTNLGSPRTLTEPPGRPAKTGYSAIKLSGHVGCFKTNTRLIYLRLLRAMADASLVTELSVKYWNEETLAYVRGGDSDTISI